MNSDILLSPYTSVGGKTSRKKREEDFKHLDNRFKIFYMKLFKLNSLEDKQHVANIVKAGFTWNALF
jgi:hypothetical protein